MPPLVGLSDSGDSERDLPGRLKGEVRPVEFGVESETPGGGAHSETWQPLGHQRPHPSPYPSLPAPALIIIIPPSLPPPLGQPVFCLVMALFIYFIEGRVRALEIKQAH